MAVVWLFAAVSFILVNPSSPQHQQVSDQYRYFMDSASSCGKTFEVGMNQVEIVGHGSVNSIAPLDCTITFSSVKINEERNFIIEVKSANIHSPGVNFYMYDSSTLESPIDSFAKGKTPGANYEKKTTSGSFVTFRLKRVNEDDFAFDIRIVASPMVGGLSNSEDCAGGKSYNCREYFVYNPFTKEVVIGIVGGIFGLVLFIIIPLILFCCWRRAKGVNRRWDEHKLSNPHFNTAADIHSSNASAKGTTDTRSRDYRSKDLWTSQSSKAPFSSVRGRSDYSRGGRSTRYSEDDDSVFDDASDIPPKRRPPPPPYERYDSRDELDRAGGKYDRSRNMGSYRKPRGGDGRGQKGPELYRNNSENSFVQSKDDHPQETFVERVIEPRVRPKPHNEDLDPYDIIDNKKLSKGYESDPLVDHGVQCENESESDNPRETESEDGGTETDTDDEENTKALDSKTVLYAKPNKLSHPDRPVPAERNLKQKNPPNIENRPPQNPVVQPVPINPMTGQPMPPMAMMAGMPPPQRMPYPGYMMAPRPMPGHPQPQFIPPTYQSAIRPFPPGTNQFQQMPPRYMGPPRPQQQQPPLPVINSNVAPTFSHLVQRGYNDGRHSPISNSTQASHHSDLRANHTDDSDMNVNLGSGVELMKRTTDV